MRWAPWRSPDWSVYNHRCRDGHDNRRRRAATAVTVSGSGGAIFGEAGSLDVVDSGANNVVNAAFGAGLFNATVFGAGDTIVSGNATTNMSLTNTAQNALIFGVGTGALNLVDQGSNDTI